MRRRMRPVCLLRRQRYPGRLTPAKTMPLSCRRGFPANCTVALLDGRSAVALCVLPENSNSECGCGTHASSSLPHQNHRWASPALRSEYADEGVLPRGDPRGRLVNVTVRGEFRGNRQVARFWGFARPRGMGRQSVWPLTQLHLEFLWCTLPAEPSVPVGSPEAIGPPIWTLIPSLRSRAQTADRFRASPTY